MLMKKFLIFLACFFAIALTAFALFRNFTGDYFHWNLPEELEFKEYDGSAVHTKFRADSPYGIMAIVNVQPPNKALTGDLWQHYNEYISVKRKAMNEYASQIGAEYTILKQAKIAIAGYKAVRTIYKVESDGFSYYQIDYNFLKDHSIWNVAAKFQPEAWNELTHQQRILIFKGFGFGR